MTTVGIVGAGLLDGAPDTVLARIAIADEAAEPLPPYGWQHPVVKTIDAERRAALPTDKLGERQAWRNRRLMALVAHKKAAAARD